MRENDLKCSLYAIFVEFLPIHLVKTRTYWSFFKNDCYNSLICKIFDKKWFVGNLQGWIKYDFFCMQFL